MQRKDLGAVKITKRDSFGYFNSSQVEAIYSKAVWWERLAKQFWKVAYRTEYKVYLTEIIYVTVVYFNSLSLVLRPEHHSAIWSAFIQTERWVLYTCM